MSPTGKSFRFVRACERARRGEAAWASERRGGSVAGAGLGQKMGVGVGPERAPRLSGGLARVLELLSLCFLLF